jgi:hypothetical protein
MAKYYFFFGGQAYEFERPEVPEIIPKEGIKAEVVGSKYKAEVAGSKYKVVILNVRN